MLYSFLWLAICQRSTVNVAAIRSMIATCICYIRLYIYINCIYVYMIASEFCLRNLPQTFCELFSFLFDFSLGIVDVVLVVVLVLVLVVTLSAAVVVVVAVTVQLVVAS